jgi:hypothetical protein
MPIARAHELVIEPFGDELFVYDLTRDTVHCLNRTAAFVWGRCDGHTSVAEMARIVREELRLPAAGEAVVCMALERLSRAQLLQAPVTVPDAHARSTRRAVLRAAGIAFLVPMVDSIVAPRAAIAGPDAPRAQ